MFIDVIKKEMKKEWNEYTKHSFGKLIAKGQLKITSFNEYILQDIIYLNKYAKCWTKLATLTSNHNEIEYAQKLAMTIIDEELKFRNKHKIKDINEIKIMDATKKYIDYMNKISNENNYIYLFFALLACFVGYAYLAKYMLKFKINKKYANWINIYTSNKFFEASDQIMKITWDKWKDMNKNDKIKCKDIFKNTLVLEKNFFDQVL